MSVSKWAYEPEKCDGGYCCGDCDECAKEYVDVADSKPMKHGNEKDQIHRLNLYLTYLKECVVEPDKWAAFENRFSGLPGFENVDA